MSLNLHRKWQQSILHLFDRAAPIADGSARVVGDDRPFVKILDVVQIQPHAGLGDDIAVLRNRQHQFAAEPMPAPSNRKYLFALFVKKFAGKSKSCPGLNLCKDKANAVRIGENGLGSGHSGIRQVANASIGFNRPEQIDSGSAADILPA